MRLPPALLSGLAALAAMTAPATAAAADTPLAGLSADSGALLASGATIVSAPASARPAVSILDAATFAPAAAVQGRVLDLGTDRAGAPVLVRARCAGGAALCTTPLGSATPVTRIAAVDPAHCQTTGAAVDRGRLALAVVARTGRPGQRCHAGIYERAPGATRVRLRHAVTRWRIGNPVELYNLDVTLDLRGTTALLRIHQSSFSSGDGTDETQRLRTVSLRSGKAKTIATATAVENGTDGLVLADAALTAAGIVAVARCATGQGEPVLSQVLRWPTTGGAAAALTAAPFSDIVAAAAGTPGLVIRAADGSAVLRDDAAYGRRPAPPSLNCRV